MEAVDLLHLRLQLSEQELAVALFRMLDTVLTGYVHSRWLGRNLKAQGLRRSI